MSQQGPMTRVVRKADVSVPDYTIGSAGPMTLGATLLSELIFFFFLFFFFCLFAFSFGNAPCILWVPG